MTVTSAGPDRELGTPDDIRIPRLKLHRLAPAPEQVFARRESAIDAGGTDNGPPGLRPHYHQNYYGAFVRDPDGHNIEACCHRPAS